MLTFQQIVSKLIDQVDFIFIFIKCMVLKDISLGHILGKWGFFFGFCNAIFCRHIQWTSKFGIAKFLTKRHKNSRSSVSFYKD